MPTGLKHFKHIYTEIDTLYAIALDYLRTSVKVMSPATRFEVFNYMLHINRKTTLSTSDHTKY
jgi:hypothetical protein